MENKILEILENIDEEILDYDGEDLIEAGIIDSFTIVEIVTEIENVLGIKTKTEDIIYDNFKTVKAICNIYIK